jgi:hypothetical protein
MFQAVLFDATYGIIAKALRTFRNIQKFCCWVVSGTTYPMFNLLTDLSIN